MPHKVILENILGPTTCHLDGAACYYLPDRLLFQVQYNGVWLTGENRQFSVEGGQGRGGLRGMRLLVRGATEGGIIVARGATEGWHGSHIKAKGAMMWGLVGCSEPLA